MSFLTFYRWLDAMAARPAVKTAMSLFDKIPKTLLKTDETIERLPTPPEVTAIPIHK